MRFGDRTNLQDVGNQASRSFCSSEIKRTPPVVRTVELGRFHSFFADHPHWLHKSDRGTLTRHIQLLDGRLFSDVVERVGSRLTGSTHSVDSVTQARWLMSVDDAPSLTSKRPASATQARRTSS
jgi:hypothetical protein